MSFKKETFRLTAQGIIDNLAKRNIEGFYCEDSASLVEQVTSLMEEGAVVSWGGSQSVKECGLMDAIRSGKYNLIDRTLATNMQEERELQAKTVLSDYYLMSTNAMTLSGEMVNIDGNGNRLSALIYGPKTVIIVVGMNKITADVESAYKRVRTLSCPPNAVRLNRNTPCGKTGICADCLSPDCFCNQIVITRRSGHVGRIKVFLVGEELGY